MKISKERLKQLVQEELSISLGGAGDVGPDVMIGGEEPKKETHDSDGRMAKQNLWKMVEYAKELYNLIDDDEDLEPWVEEKIAIASFMMDSVGHYMQYEKNSHHADASMGSDNIDLGNNEEEYESPGEEEMGDEESEEEYEFDPDEEEYDDEEDEEGEEEER